MPTIKPHANNIELPHQMASSSSKMPIHQITQDEFNLFHAIDRRLFSILVFTLGRDPGHATRVMGLWLWLEKATLKSTIVNAILTLPYPTIENLFDESMLCLHVAAFGPTVKDHIPVLQALLQGRSVDFSLAYFHENKVLVLNGVGKMVEDVCYRAFQDIVGRMQAEGSTRASHMPPPPPLTHMPPPHVPTPHVPSPHVPSPHVSAPHVSAPHVTASYMPRDDPVLRRGFDQFNPYYSVASSLLYEENNEIGFDLQSELDELYLKMNGVNLDGNMNMREADRSIEARETRGGRGSNNKTLFITFSKGYPISKNEVREFFARYFGDVIEGLHMQEVGKNEQPLYARLVVREAPMVDIVLQGQKRIKFSINGKHACVRKYVRRRSESPPSPSEGE